MTDGIPWSLAVKVADRVAGSHPLEHTYHVEAFRRQAPDLMARAGELVGEETGLVTPGPVGVEVVGRGDWVRRNVEFFSRLMEPAEEKIALRLNQGGVIGSRAAGLARQLVAAETGALLGVMARRVLGQYELVLPTDESEGDVVFLVGPNVLAMERANQFKPDEFRFWLALHECAHRAQFTAVPWMQEYFLSLVRGLIEGAEPERGRWRRIVEEIKTASRDETDIIGETGLLGLFANESQRDVIDQVQALMSVLEGHGHVIMDRVGARHLVTQDRMSSILKRRRMDARTAAFFKITGLGMKLRQYELGERFVLEVERRAGWEAVDLVWQSVETLPTLDEINEPGAWLERVA
ncbi:MAG: zinc-dependent metalloprotease [Acidimicrobiia bacterium]|nr:zinc-dependent metalloprotease [Acidimicrobiia bacterium]